MRIQFSASWFSLKHPFWFKTPGQWSYITLKWPHLFNCFSSKPLFPVLYQALERNDFPIIKPSWRNIIRHVFGPWSEIQSQWSFKSGRTLWALFPWHSAPCSNETESRVFVLRPEVTYNIDCCPWGREENDTKVLYPEEAAQGFFTPVTLPSHPFNASHLLRHCKEQERSIQSCL